MYGVRCTFEKGWSLSLCLSLLKHLLHHLSWLGFGVVFPDSLCSTTCQHRIASVESLPEEVPIVTEAVSPNFAFENVGEDIILTGIFAESARYVSKVCFVHSLCVCCCRCRTAQTFVCEF